MSACPRRAHVFLSRACNILLDASVTLSDKKVSTLKIRVQKNPGFFKAQPSGFYWFFWTSRKKGKIIQKLSNLKP